jgi:hypothetical protein
MVTKPLVKPYAMKKGSISFAGSDYTQAVSQAEFVPSVATSEWRGIGGNTIQQTANATWALVLALAQDDDPAGLLRYLFDNEGQTAVAVLIPVAPSGTNYTATVVLSPSNIGGTASADLAVATVTLACVGKPVPTPGVLADDDGTADQLVTDDDTADQLLVRDAPGGV